MSLNRRALLVTGGAAILITGGVWAATREPKASQAPWRAAADGFDDARLDILAYAILSPSPHNMQPWRVELEGDNAFRLFCDETRLLPETDPPNRQITIGFGCFLELARQAAAEKGYNLQITPFPDGEPQPTLDQRPIAYVRMQKDAAVKPDPLFSEALSRRTNRNTFNESPVPEESLSAIRAAAGSDLVAKTTTDPALLVPLRALTVDAWRTEWNHPPTRRESIAVTRIGKNAINENPNGVSLSGPMMDALGAAGVVSAKTLDEPGSTAFDATLNFYNEACESAQAFLWLKTKTNSRLDQLNTGAAWIRTQMAANAQGVAFQPLSQALQEFPVMAEYYQRAHDLLGAANGETVQMLARLGYADQPSPSPREPLMSKLITA